MRTKAIVFAVAVVFVAGGFFYSQSKVSIGASVETANAQAVVVDECCSKCTGADPCTACKNCKDCAHCKIKGNSCGVCKKKDGCLSEARPR